MAVDFLAIEKGRDLSKRRQREDIAWQQAQEEAEFARQNAMFNRQSTAYLAPIYNYWQSAAAEGVSDADFITSARDTILADPGFQRLAPEAQASILKNVSDTAVGIANRYRQNNDSQTATRLYRTFGQSGLAQNPLQMLGASSSVMDAWAAQPDSGVIRNPDGTYSIGGRVLSPNEAIALAAAKQANPQLTAVGAQLSLLQGEQQRTAQQQQLQMQLMIGGYTQQEGNVVYKPDGSGGVDLTTGALVPDMRQKTTAAVIPGSTVSPLAGAPGAQAATPAPVQNPIQTIAQLQTQLQTLLSQQPQLQAQQTELQARLNQLAPMNETPAAPIGTTAALIEGLEPSTRRMWPYQDTARMAQASALDNQLFDVNRQVQQTQSRLQQLTEQLQAATGAVQAQPAQATAENFNELIELGQSTKVQIPWLAERLQKYRERLVQRKDPKQAELIRKIDIAIANYGGAK
jgi:hypothetical protein